MASRPLRGGGEGWCPGKDACSPQRATFRGQPCSASTRRGRLHGGLPCHRPGRGGLARTARCARRRYQHRRSHHREDSQASASCMRTPGASARRPRVAAASAMMHTTPVDALVRPAFPSGPRRRGEVPRRPLRDIGRVDLDAVAAWRMAQREGAEVIMLAGTVGRLHPLGQRERLARITERLDPMSAFTPTSTTILTVALNLQASSSAIGCSERPGRQGARARTPRAARPAGHSDRWPARGSRDEPRSSGRLGWRPERIADRPGRLRGPRDAATVTDPSSGQG